MNHIQPWLSDAPMQVRICGMAGSRQGWQEAPYAAVPCTPLSSAVHVSTKDKRLDVRILSGLKQNAPADVMRGEETQIAGFLSDEPHFAGVIALPGTHSKWAEIKAGEVTRFQTMMTGESFALLSQSSVLRFSIEQWDDEVFMRSALAVYHAPETASAALFQIRASDLLQGDKFGKAKLSGVLIGSELAGTQALWHERKIAIVGAGHLAESYGRVLRALCQDVSVYKGSEMTLKGLKMMKAIDI